LPEHQLLLPLESATHPPLNHDSGLHLNDEGGYPGWKDGCTRSKKHDG
jgi:hypothetical protein